MTYALIGCGRIAPNHIAAARSSGLTVAALCDTDPGAMRALSERMNLCAAARYTDRRAMLDDIRPDLVAIAAPSGEHARIALDCIASGAHVIIEKPIALSLSDADAILAAASARGVQVCVSHQNRFNKSVRHIREAMDAGRFGRMLHGAAHVRWQRGAAYYAQAPWRGTWAQDGGCLMNQCIHSADLLLYMMGEAAEVTACTDNLAHPEIEAEDFGLAMIRFASGAYGLLEGTTCVCPRNLEETLYLFGTQGTVKAGGISDGTLEVWRLMDSPEEEAAVCAAHSETPPNVYGFGHTPLYADMLAAIRSGRPPLCDGAAGRRALELILAIYRSAAEHRSVALPLSGGSTLDFAGRFGGGRERA